MAYNYYQPYGYMAQPQQMPYNPPVQPQQNAVDERIWVASQNAAEAYLMGVNDHKILWDGSKPVFYEKRTDASGRPFPMLAYEYKIRDEAEALPVAPDFEERLNRIEEKIARLEEGKKTVKAQKKEETEV